MPVRRPGPKQPSPPPGARPVRSQPAAPVTAVRGARPGDAFAATTAAHSSASTSSGSSRLRDAVSVSDAAARTQWAAADRRSGMIATRAAELAGGILGAPGARTWKDPAGWQSGRRETRDSAGNLTVLELARTRGRQVEYVRRELVGERIIERTYRVGREGTTQALTTRQWPRDAGALQARPAPRTLDQLADRGRASVHEEVFRLRGGRLTHQERVRDEGGLSVQRNAFSSGPAGNTRLPGDTLARLRPDAPALLHERSFRTEPRGGSPSRGREVVVFQDDLRLTRAKPSGERRGFELVERRVEAGYEALRVFETDGAVSEQVVRNVVGQVLREQVRYQGQARDGTPVVADAQVDTEFSGAGFVSSRRVRGTDSDLARTQQSYTRTESEGPLGLEVNEAVESALELPGSRDRPEERWAYRRELHSRLSAAGWALVGTREELVSSTGERVSAEIARGGSTLRVGGTTIPLGRSDTSAALARLSLSAQVLAAHVLEGVAGLMKRHAEAGGRRSGAQEWNQLLTRTLQEEFAHQKTRSGQASAAPMTRLSASATALLAAVSRLNASATQTLVVRPGSWAGSPLARASSAEQSARVGGYELLHKLGTGGMGEVFLARSAQASPDQPPVVLKRLLPHLAEDATFLNRFLDEARLIAQLDHPNIAGIRDLGCSGDTWYLVLEHVDGPDLRKVVKRARTLERPVPIPVACRILAGAAQGLAHAHGATDPGGRPLGIVHRDVSPHNVMVAFDGAVKLIDFGVARAAGRAAKSQTGALLGKVPYMSPEQVAGNPLDERSDLFSLGSVFWEVLAGRRLFQGANHAVTLMLVSDCRIERPSRHRPELPPALEQLVLSLLEKDPGGRWPSAAALAEALAPYAAPDEEVRSFLLELFPDGAGLDAVPLTPPDGLLLGQDLMETGSAR